MNDPYAVLGLKRGASEPEAKQAFHKLAKTCHPDLHPNDTGAEKRFKDINAAYDAIRNPQPDPGVSWQFHSGPFAGGSPFAGGQFDDIFSEMFGRRNKDHVIELRMTLEESFQGKDLNLAVPINSKSPRTVKITIPAGIAHGMRVRVPQGGQQTHPGLPAGDLYIAINIQHHDRFTRQGANLMMMAPATVFDVLLCKDIEVIGIEGNKMRTNIPPGFDNRRLRLAGQGMPDPYSGVRGDLLIELVILYPTLTDEQRTLIQQAAQ